MRPAAPMRDFPGPSTEGLETRMQTKTAMAVAGSVLAVPSTALAATAVHDTHVPGHGALRASGRPTLDAGHKHRMVRTNVRLARREARLRGVHLRHGYERRVRDDAVSVIRARNHRLRQRIARLKQGGGGSTASAGLQAIAACESGGNPSTNTGNGFFGKYQFTQSTWQSVGGTGNPAAAPEAEQDRRAAMLLARSGSSQWPVCGG
jgi:Transglycosylase-like domain